MQCPSQGHLGEGESVGEGAGEGRGREEMMYVMILKKRGKLKQDIHIRTYFY